MVEGNDQRVFQRYMARFPIKIKDSNNEFGTKLFMRDASAEGLKLVSRERVFLNDSLSIDIKLPDGKTPLTLNGQVVWVKTHEPDLLWDIGLKFHKVNFMNMQRLFQFIDDSSSV